MTIQDRSAMLAASPIGGFIVGNQAGAAESQRAPQDSTAQQGFRPHGWWRVMEFRIGVIPLPVYVVCVAVLAYFLVRRELPAEINVAIAVLTIGGFTCAELGKRLPWIGRV